MRGNTSTGITMEIASMNYYFTGILIILMVALALFGGPPGY
jgi:type IV secretory pathway VirB3-like protein|tara:strand:- start:1068 stop:1190 length:123 start_codon:yes stop_codon:yes gene_type:complete